MRKNKLLLLLALLLTAATGAWADESSESFTTNSRAASYTGEHFKISVDDEGKGDDDGFYLNIDRNASIEALNGEIITKVEFTAGYYEITRFRSGVGTTTYEGEVATVSGVNATSLTVNAADVLQIKAVKVYYSTAPAPDATGYSVTMKDGTVDAKNWTITSGQNSAKGDAADGLTGLSEKDAVTLQYTGRLKVKGVKATSEAPAEATPALSITSPSVGQVIGSDGKNYDYGSLPTGVTAVAKICYVSGSNGLALALTDEEGTMEWRPAIETIAAHTAPFTGGTWKVASKDEWSNMITAAGSYSALRDGFSSVGGTNMQSGYYWTSTEWDSNGAWSYNFSDGYWASDPMDFESYVRACLAFTVEQAAGKPAAAVTTAPKGAEIVGVGKTTALVSGGVADGGTLMYAVTTTNTKPASTDGFSATVPTAQTITASGTVYVWYYVKGNDTHSDSEIAGPVSVTLAEEITWNSTNVFNSAHQMEVLSIFESAPLTYEGITISFSGENVSSFTPYGGMGESSLVCFGDEGDSFTFTSPSGKNFCKIEIINNSDFAFDKYGDWTQPEDNKAVWSGTAANAVTLGTVYTVANNLNSIVFYLVDAE